MTVRANAGECPLCAASIRSQPNGCDMYCSACDRIFVGGFHPERIDPTDTNDTSTDILRYSSSAGAEGVPAPTTWVPAPSWGGSETIFPLPEATTNLWIGRAEKFRRTLPPHGPDGPHPQFRAKAEACVPPPYVLSIRNGQAWGPEAAIMDSSNRLIADVSNRAFGRDPAAHPAFSHDWLAPPRYVSDRVAVIAARGGGRNYAHWMFDVLPRLDTLRRSGLCADGDRVLVNSTRLRFHMETLEALLVSPAAVLTIDALPHLRAEALLVPSLARRGDTVPSRTCTFLRETFLPLASVRSDSPTRLFVSRADARWRRLANEDEIGRALAGRGFTTVTGLGQLPLAEHVGLFARADAIVCPYGAGMVNTVFCRSDAVVVELLSDGFVDPHFWTVNERVGTRYRYVIGSPSSEGGPADGMQADFSIDVEQLLNELTVAGIY